MTETKKNPIGQFIENTLVPISTAFAQNRYVRCIGTGSQNLMAIIMIGAVFNLLNSIQIDPYQSFIQATGIAAFLNAVYNACMNFMGVFMVFSVGYAGAKIFGHDEMAFNNGLMSLMSYLIMVPVATNEVGSTVVVLDYLGSHGVFLAFILGIMATKINIALVERNITIKMPAGVPENVTQCFTSIIPGAAIALVSSLLRGLFTLTPWGNVIDAVYALLQTPLANITGSWVASSFFCCWPRSFGSSASTAPTPCWPSSTPCGLPTCLRTPLLLQPACPSPTCGTPPCTTLPATAAAAAPWVW